MSIVWGVHHAIRTVVATASGELRLEDLEHYLDGLAAAATLSYRKVFDLTHGRLALSRDEMLALGDRIRGLESMEPMGKVAVIAVADEAYQQARLFETLVVAHRPLKIFREAEAAYEWLKVEPPAGVELAGTGLFGEAPKIEARRD
jgi:hypothetical protein